MTDEEQPTWNLPRQHAQDYRSVSVQRDTTFVRVLVHDEYGDDIDSGSALLSLDEVDELIAALQNAKSSLCHVYLYEKEECPHCSKESL